MSDIEPPLTTASGELSWAEFIRYRLVTNITTSKVTDRLDFIHHSLLVRLRRKDLPQEALPSLLGLLKLTYTRYQDRASRQAILDVFKELNAWNSTLFQKTFAPVLAREAEKTCKRSMNGECVTSSSDRFVLLTWVNTMVSFVLENNNDDMTTSAQLLGFVVNAQALLIDSLAGEEDLSRKKPSSIWRSSLSQVRRTIREHATQIPRLFDTALANSSTCTPSFINAVLIGIIIDVSLHLKNMDGKSLFITKEERKNQLIDYYLKNIISSRIPVRHAAMISFNGFIHAAVSETCFQDQFLPVLEKMMLRSPEIALQALACIISSFSFDPSSLFANKWVEPLSNHLRSTSAAVRQGAMALWRALAKESQDIPLLIKVTQHVTTPLKQGKISTPEHRVVLYQALADLAQTNDANLSHTVLTEGFFNALTGNKKDTNETATIHAIQGAGKHIAVVLYNDAYCQENKSLMETIIKVMTEGLVSPKATIRSQWASVVGLTYWEHQQPSITLADQIVKYLSPLFTTTNKIQEKPLVWKDGPLEGYVLVALLSGRVQSTWTNVPGAVNDLIKQRKYPDSLIKDGKSFLWMDRVYMKALSLDEGLWFAHALISVFTQLDQKVLSSGNNKECPGILIAQALIWILTSHPIHTVRKQTFQGMAEASQFQPEKWSHFMIQALTLWLTHLENETKGSVPVMAAASTPTTMDPLVSHYRLASVLLAITCFSKNDDDVLKGIKSSILTDLIILAHHSFIASPTDKYNWITLVQRAGLNPGELVKTHARQLKDLIRSTLSNSGKESKLFYEAALSAISTLSFIDASTFASFADHSTLLDPSLMKGIGDLEYNVWQTPKDVLYVDVLKKKNEKTESRGRKTKDQEWEDELRAELAAKNKNQAQRKLTKEEQAAVDAQLKKESDIRDKVQQVYEQINLGLDILGALTSSASSEGSNDTVLKSMGALLTVAKANAGLLVQDKLVDTYLALGRTQQQDINGSLADAICLATLRCNQVEGLPKRWLDEPLLELVNRVLYKLRFLTESRPLSVNAFLLCFPVLYEVIKQGGVACNKSAEEGREQAIEQVTMALDVLSFHASLGSQAKLMPRQEMIECLVYSIREYPSHSKIAKAALIELCTAMDGTLVTLDEFNALFQGLLSDESMVRHAALQGLEILDLTDIDYSAELWLACHDEENETNAHLAKTLWEENGMDVEEETYSDQLLNYVTSNSTFVRSAASGALAEAMELYPETVANTLTAIYSLYKVKAASLEPEYDKFGMVIPETLNRQDPWEARSGLALALKKSAPYVQAMGDIIGMVQFLINDLALGDRDELVRKQMVDAGLAVVNTHGKEQTIQRELLDCFESYLANDKKGVMVAADETQDHIRQSVVILYGGAAGFLPVGDPKIRVAVDNLIETLDTPSEVVQSAVADCLPPLIKMIKEDVPSIVDGLMKKLFTGEKYAHRRGAAYGLAGVVKGRGITALKECAIMQTLKDAVDNKRNYQYRQGALFAFETLSATLGRLFEPYIVQIIPLLLVCFSDTNMDVREASADAGRVIMSKISGHCVKLILPSILEGLDERQWRTKKASVELLGSMAYCAPKQLSVSLPNIIPRITEVLADTHAQVQNAANRSLQMFGEVISNPEIQQLVPELLQALSDPNQKTMIALKKLLQTSFVHYIDSPSLAIVMPILERGLRERGTEIKTKSAQIVGNMASLTDQKDLIPYLPVLLPQVKQVLLDPVPEARGTAAKALGGLVEKLGEENFPGLVIELLDTLKADAGGVDRQGAAQGLAEVLAGLGLERLDGLLPEIIANANNPRSYVREGFISLLVYLPATYGPRFQPYIGRIIPPILMGLADESEYVRDASLRAGRMIVTNYATKAVDLLLPELEKGLFDGNWRIRQSSVQLVGDLLFRITGTTNPNKTNQALGNMQELDDEDADEDDEANREGAHGGRKQLRDVLGKDRADRILSALYIVRRDSSGMVRQAALQVWKALVSNTPRTLRDILPTMMSMIIQLLAAGFRHDDDKNQQDDDMVSAASYEQRAVAARTLCDLVTKLGERVMADMLPILQDGMQSQDASIRQGVTVAYSEIMASAERVQILDFADQIVPAIRQALCDPSTEVREAAAQAFDTLHQNLGARAIDDILPFLLNQLQAKNEASTYALSALKEIMAVRANVVFPVLIPTLITVPINAFNAGALASLVTVAGPTLNRRLSVILDALISSRVLTEQEDEETQTQLCQAIEALMLSVDDEEGVEALMTTLHEQVRSDDPARRAVSCDVVATFFTENDQALEQLEADENYVADWISALVLLLNDHTMTVVESAWKALSAVVKSVGTNKERYEGYVASTRRAIDIMSAPGTDVRGFCLIPKGLGAILPIFLQGLMYGATDVREQSALALGDLTERTTSDALKPFVTQMTGPLIRIVGDRYPAQVKSAILQTLSLLLTKVPMHVKPFLPQLQRTFIKSLQEPEEDIRVHAAEALRVLIPLQVRVDPLVTELVSGIRTSTTAEIKQSLMLSLNDVVTQVGGKMNDVSKKGIQAVIQDGEQSDDTSLQTSASLLATSLSSL
ncbi:armadillo-type protein [Halteromyces radiatus]|uniref:armadillo-type protein n=1 Tax=Halteromyces radiatus TaxID=101107 RepID=UPI0022212925|nr:armadillo-type protein [Halteromyces radiatus]KAI8084473.1 armadillo-type protein [Halteromyces radiatus]